MHSTEGDEKRKDRQSKRRDEGGRKVHKAQLDEEVPELTAGLKLDLVHRDRSRRVHVPLLVCSEPIRDALLEFIDLRCGSSPTDVDGEHLRHVS